MIEIRIPSAGSLDLPDELVFSLTVPSPYWMGGDLAIVPGGYSLPITISANENNRKLLGYPDFANVKTRQITLTASLFLDGNYWDTGTLYVQKATGNRYKIQLFFGAGQLTGIRTKNLKDYDYGSDVVVTNTNAGWQAFIDAVDADPDRLFAPVAYSPDGTSFEYRHIGCRQVADLLEKIFAAEGYTVADSAFTATPLDALYVAGDALYTVQNATGTVIVYAYDFVPQFPSVDLVRGLIKDFNLGLYVDVFSKKVYISVGKDVLTTTPIPMDDRQREGFELVFNDALKVKYFAFDWDDPFRDSDDDLSFNQNGSEITSKVGSWEDKHTFTANAFRTALKTSDTFNEVDTVGRTTNITGHAEKAIIGFEFSKVDNNGDPYNEFSDTAAVWLHWSEANDDGYYENFWKPYLDAIVGQVDVAMQLKWEDVHNVRNLLHNRISLIDPVGGSRHNALFQEIKIVVDNRTGLKQTVQKMVLLK